MTKSEDYAAMLQNVISELNEFLSTKSETEQSYKPRPDKWSQKEILGHLIDSAINNIARVVRAQYEPLVVQNYDQDNWVGCQKYNSQKSENLLSTWITLNNHFIRVILNMKDSSLENNCKMPNGSNVTLQWLIEDYIKHIKHHMNQIYSLGK